ncbi:unnamed protein product [Callosobruchus maculatus]|uniref:Uncharacterized protein n=1 Tax=Callosobruchus maculatus TaxID=64391 RepID=A0A653CA28_CALMS|nr:unnamed protein product [Callosobruchus maculatus]
MLKCVRNIVHLYRMIVQLSLYADKEHIKLQLPFWIASCSSQIQTQVFICFQIQTAKDDTKSSVNWYRIIFRYVV